MSKAVQCPGCGGQISIATDSVRVVHCGYCQSVSVVSQESLKVLGELSLLSTAESCLAVGWKVLCQGRELEVLGRIQFRYSAGLWDEWWVRFLDDGTDAWISQDEGKYIIQKPLSLEKGMLPDFDSVKPGDTIKLGRHKLWVREKDEGSVVGVQGQLPHYVEPESKLRYLNVANNVNFVSIEYYPDGEVVAYKGRLLKAQELKTIGSLDGRENTQTYQPPTLGQPSGTKDRNKRGAKQITPAKDQIRPVKLSCPNCGGAIEFHDRDRTTMLVCQYCRGALDVSVSGAPKLLYLSEGRRLKPHLEMGATGQFKGKQWTVIGRVRYKEVDSDGTYLWDSYQLYCPGEEYIFLEVENGHWLLFESLNYQVHFKPKSASPGNRFRVMGKPYRVFERSHCRVNYVEGELSWVAQIRDRVNYMDAICPPLLVSAEWTETELEWSIGKYMTREEVAKAFGIQPDSLPRPEGVAPAQPFRQSADAKFCLAAGTVAGIVLMVMAWFTCFNPGGQTVLQADRIPSSAYLSPEGYVSEPFELSPGSHICRIHADGLSLNNSWVALSVAILNEEDQLVNDSDIVVERYSGTEGGESWSEGSRTDYQLVRIEGPGSYRLNLFGEAGVWSPRGGDTSSNYGSEVTVRIDRDVVPARYYTYGMLVCFALPAFEFVRYVVFRKRKFGDTDD